MSIKKTRQKRKVGHVNSNNPMDYFTPGKEEYLYMCKVVSKIAYYYSQRSPIAFEELSSEGKLGAWKAALSFKEKKDAKFPTWMYHYVEGYIKNEVIKNTDKYNITYSLDSMNEDSNYELTSEDLGSESGHDPIESIELEEILNILDPRSKKVLMLDAEGYSLKEIGGMIVPKGQKALSHVAVIQIKRKARETIQEYLNSIGEKTEMEIE